ncbi:MAG: hypothetical protein ACIALR_17055 [Blastopirellula sp. JB062]
MKRYLALFSIVAALLFAAPQFAQAGHWQHRGRLARDADSLHRATHRLHRLIHHRTGFSQLEEEALRLDDAAAHFAETAHFGGSLAHLRLDFRAAQRELRHVQSLILHACHVRHDWVVRDAWAQVERAFDRVYYDLYSTHCGYVSYRCSIGGIHDRPHDHHHGRRPGRIQSPPNKIIQGTIQVGPFQVQAHKVLKKSQHAWKHNLKNAFKP